MAKSAIHITIPVKEAYSFSGIEARLKAGLKEAGCEACCSGFDIFLDVERDYLFNPSFKTTGVQLASRALDRPTSTLLFDAKFGSDVNNMLKGLQDFATFNGHAPCASGLDIALMQFKDSMNSNVGTA
jgi:hypothetical protein